MIKSKFRYLPKRWMMNKNEYRFYKSINSFLDHDKYSIIPQVHLEDLVNLSYSNPTSRIFSLRHINQKSVDFVICNRNTMHPLLAIELDGYSHNSQKVKDQDTEKTRILMEARIPLQRFHNYEIFDKQYIEREIDKKLTMV